MLGEIAKATWDMIGEALRVGTRGKVVENQAAAGAEMSTGQMIEKGVGLKVRTMKVNQGNGGSEAILPTQGAEK